MLEVRDLQAGYGPLKVLHGLNFDVQAGKLIALLGSNGAGKTTTVNTIAGLLPMTGGDLLLNGRSLRREPAHDRFGHGIALVPQARHLFPEMTVCENLELGAISLGLRRGELQSRLGEIYAWFPRLEARAKQRAGSLSGGEQQMLATGRALISRPMLLLLDEPTTGLAPLVVAELGRICLRLKEAKQTILIVEQNIELALSIADHVYVIQSGRIAMSSGPAEIRASSNDLFDAYLGL